jgi:acetyl esterase
MNDRDEGGADLLAAGHRAFLAALAATGKPGDRSLAEMRAAAAGVRRPWQDGGPAMTEVQDLSIASGTDTIRARIYWPAAERPLPAIIYLHGGGWTFLGIETHDRIMREYAARSGWAVIGLDFPLAPEAPFPGALNACLAAIETALDHGAGHGLLPLFALGGDSSGANLALGAALALRDRGAHAPVALILNYGVYDSDFTRPSYRTYSLPPFTLSADRMAWFWNNYCPDPATRRDPLAAPLLANLAGLPPARLVVAGQDVLRDENLALATRLAEAGNAVSLDHYPAAPHAFLEAIALDDTGLHAIERACAWLNDLWQQSVAAQAAMGPGAGPRVSR